MINIVLNIISIIIFGMRWIFVIICFYGLNDIVVIVSFLFFLIVIEWGCKRFVIYYFEFCMKVDNIKNEIKFISLLLLIFLFIMLFVIFDLYLNDLEL